MSEDVNAVIEAELERLRSMLVVELRALWRAKFKSDPPKAFGPDLLRRSIAYKIQEDAYGGLDRATARLLKTLMVQLAKSNGPTLRSPDARSTLSCKHAIPGHFGSWASSPRSLSARTTDRLARNLRA